eukprot:CAMPEP_0181086344 /NCGR_PEP_ID=MMETSP1071-20121207/5697_1 /TAXON_ID=35127 /ORGANISM="Thalassiosira sp., Strain NH16" /LENGTH=305 /DNA_ID=CAMNT_0023168175 /DNA_START=115 /DNA_END=1028 /DNA_ORIENTATION=+
MSDGPGDVEIFFTNAKNVPLDKQMPYIMMMATDCIEGFNVKEIHPYSAFLTNKKLAGGGWVRKLNPNKDLVVQELKRRDPAARPNKSNKSADEIVQLFTPITDPRDLEYIAKKEGEFRKIMLNLLEDFQRARDSRSQRESVSSPLRSKRPRTGDKGTGGNIAGGNQHFQSTYSLTMHAVEIVMDATEEAALSYAWNGFIAIADANGNPMMVKRVGEPFPASFEIAVGKAKAAAHMGTFLGNTHDVPRGGFSIVIDGICYGGISLSGQKTASLELIADAGINALRNILGGDQSSGGQVLSTTNNGV